VEPLVTRGDVELWGRAALSAIPYIGGPAEVLYSGYRDRRIARALEFLEPLAELLDGPQELQTRLAGSDGLDALFGRAIRLAAECGLAAKRTALGRVVAAALGDEAMLDRATLLIDTLQQVEAPHVRALGRTSRSGPASSGGRRSAVPGPAVPNTRSCPV
jgi:hypothetical protein